MFRCGIGYKTIARHLGINRTTVTRHVKRARIANRVSIQKVQNISIPCMVCLYQTGLGYGRIARRLRTKKSIVFKALKLRLNTGKLLPRRSTYIRVKAPSKPKPDLTISKLLRLQKRTLSLPNKKRKKRLRCYLWKWAKHGLNPGIMPIIVGCSRTYFRGYIEAQFTARMSWSNYGPIWHLDHIIPCSKFNLQNPQDVKQCFHFTNIQPLLARHNLMKAASVGVTQQQFQIGS